MQTLQQLDESGKNNWDAVRFFTAALVIYSHAYAVSGFSDYEPLASATGFISFGALAVEIFFVISGYLITRSLIQRNNMVDFVEARVLRIFPALIACCVVSAYVLGPLVTTLSWADYFSNKQPLRYILGNASLMDLQWVLPGVFEQNIYKNSINGSLWSLPTELKMYCVMFALGMCVIPFKQYRARALTVLVTCGLMFLFISQFDQITHHHKGSPKPLIVFYLLGSLTYLCRRYIVMSITISLALWAAYMIMRGTPTAVPLYYAALTYSIFIIAFDPSIQLHNFAQHGDFSYGLYLYGFPVKQTIILFAGAMSATQLFVLAFPVTLLIAWLSWTFVEAPALAKKGFVSELYTRLFKSRSVAPQASN